MTGPAPGRALDTPLKIAVISAEASADRLGAGLMRALRTLAPGVRLVGLGGDEMQREGLDLVVRPEHVAFMGLGMLSRLPAVLRYLREVADAVLASRPDVLVIIDSPEFTHRIARRLRRQAPEIPIIDYVSPSIWAWRPGRARAMRGYVDHVLALLPFEPQAHARLGGPSCTYVGHPLVEQLGVLRPLPEEAARRLAEPPLILALPGSRAGEVRRLARLFGDTLARLRRTIGPIEVVLPILPHLRELVREAVADWEVPPRIVHEPSDKWAALRSARAALTKSGTVTLELALAGVPMVAAYKITLIEELIARVAGRVPSVILANLVIGENVVPELLQREARADRLAGLLGRLVEPGTPERERQIEAFARLDALMAVGVAPSVRAAEIVLSHARRR